MGQRQQDRPLPAAHWRRQPWVWQAAPPLAVVLLVIVVWELVVRISGIPAIVLPGPLRVFQAARQNASHLGYATLLTAATALCGLSLSFLVGTLVAMIFSQAALVRRSLFPFAIFLQTVPIVAIAPVIVIWMGEGAAAVVVIAAIISLFPIVTNTTEGLISVPEGWQELFRLNHASRWQTLRYLQLPAALPHLVTGLKIAAGTSVLGTIVGEIFAGAGSRSPGLGYLIFAAKGQFKLDYLFAAVFCCTLLGIVFFSAVSWFSDRWLLHWTDRKIY